ncbi:hypothetical protein Tco_0931379 [Tanacetum coccineum]
MTHEDGDNDAIGGNDDERAINNVVEEEDGEWIYFLGGNSSSGTKKYRGSNSSDGGNTRDGVKIAGEVIGSGGEIGNKMLVRPLNKDYCRKTRILVGSYLVFSKELKELLPNEAGK